MKCDKAKKSGVRRTGCVGGWGNRGNCFALIRGGPQKMKFIYKKVCIYCYMFKPQSISKYSLFDAIKSFFPLLKIVFELVDFDAF